MGVDELRRGIESLHPEHYHHWSYYGKPTAANTFPNTHTYLITCAQNTTVLQRNGLRP